MKSLSSSLVIDHRWLLTLTLITFSLALGTLAYWPDQPLARQFSAGTTILAYVFFCVFFILQHHRKVRPIKRLSSDLPEVSIFYASQTGYAEQLAQQTAHSLQEAGMQVQVLPLAQVNAPMLQEAKKILFIVSTTGEGDAPDNAAGFVRKLMSQSFTLAGLHYGILALGDRHYQHYCAFGHQLQHWLHQQQAQNLFDLVEVDNGEQGALRHWQYHLGGLSGNSTMADWISPSYSRWTLTERHLLNPDSLGAPAFHLALTANDKNILWQAGDIAEIGPANSPHEVRAILARLHISGNEEIQVDGQIYSIQSHLSTRLLPREDTAFTNILHLSAQALADALPALPHREYSIASLPGEGQLQLLVRQIHQANGELGLGSGWLTQYAELGGEITMRVRENRSFHAPDDDKPLILIGNGTGIAGLRAHLKQREQMGRHRNWLLFGERSMQHDYFYRDEITQWLSKGILQKADFAFSRDQIQRVYVQDKIAEQSVRLKEWVAEGAAIYVCGSLHGMAAAVSATLTKILGAEQLETMAEEGRYRRDVY